MSTQQFKFEVGDIVWCRGAQAKILAVHDDRCDVLYIKISCHLNVASAEIQIDWNATLKHADLQFWWRETYAPESCATWLADCCAGPEPCLVRLCDGAASGKGFVPEVVRTLVQRRNATQLAEHTRVLIRKDENASDARDPDDSGAWPLPLPDAGLRWFNDCDGYGWYVCHPGMHEDETDRCCWLQNGTQLDRVNGSAAQWWPMLPRLIQIRNLVAQRRRAATQASGAGGCGGNSGSSGVVGGSGGGSVAVSSYGGGGGGDGGCIAMTPICNGAKAETMEGGINGPLCPNCKWANNTLRKRCRNCNADLVMHPDPSTDAEVRWDAEDGRRAELAGAQPDRNCVSTPDGDCVATEPCMHSPPPGDVLLPGRRVRVTEGPWKDRCCVLVAKYEQPNRVDQERLGSPSYGTDWWYVERLGDAESRHGRALVSTAQFTAEPLLAPACTTCGGTGYSLGGFYPCGTCRKTAS